MEGDRPKVALRSLGAAVNQGWRIGSSIREKVDEYASFVDAETRLTVAVVARGWKVTEHQLVTAMRGREVLVLDSHTRRVLEVRYDGRGAAVAGGEFDTGNATALSGAWYLERNGFYEHNPLGMPVNLAFVHSPYSQAPPTPQQIDARRQCVVDGSEMTWEGESADAVLLLK